MATPNTDTDQLVQRAKCGDAGARETLFDRHRGRLKRMVACRMDPRVAARVDPSDVVQEALVDAHRKIDAYLASEPLPFYPWIRQIVWERLMKAHRFHVRAEKRSVRREEGRFLAVSDDSVVTLAGRIKARGPSPSAAAIVREDVERLRQALQELKEQDREVLILRQVEQLSVKEVAAILEISEGAVKLRRLRALERLRVLMEPTDRDRGD